MVVNGKHYRSVWREGTTVFMVNQSLLPHRFEVFESPDHQRTTRAVLNSIIRGEGAAAAAAGFALVQAAYEAPEKDFDAYVSIAADELLKLPLASRILVHTVERVYGKVKKAADPHAAKKAAAAEADAIADADVEMCLSIGERGAALIADGRRVLVHGSGGWLSGIDWGTLLAPVYQAKRGGRQAFVWVGEGRPGFYGARLLAWELREEGIPCAVIADAASGFYMSRGEVDLVIVDCERIAGNGDVLARVGTYEKAVLAKANKIPFYVAAPLRSRDGGCATGRFFPVEEQGGDDVAKMTGRDEVNALHTISVLPDGVTARSPLYDVTPARYITGYITEKGIMTKEKIKSRRAEGGT